MARCVNTVRNLLISRAALANGGLGFISADFPHVWQLRTGDKGVPSDGVPTPWDLGARLKPLVPPLPHGSRKASIQSLPLQGKSNGLSRPC